MDSCLKEEFSNLFIKVMVAPRKLGWWVDVDLQAAQTTLCANHLQLENRQFTVKVPLSWNTYDRYKEWLRACAYTLVNISNMLQLEQEQAALQNIVRIELSRLELYMKHL